MDTVFELINTYPVLLYPLVGGSCVVIPIIGFLAIVSFALGREFSFGPVRFGSRTDETIRQMEAQINVRKAEIEQLKGQIQHLEKVTSPQVIEFHEMIKKELEKYNDHLKKELGEVKASLSEKEALIEKLRQSEEKRELELAQAIAEKEGLQNTFNFLQNQREKLEAVFSLKMSDAEVLRGTFPLEATEQQLTGQIRELYSERSKRRAREVAQQFAHEAALHKASQLAWQLISVLLPEIEHDIAMSTEQKLQNMLDSKLDVDAHRLAKQLMEDAQQKGKEGIHPSESSLAGFSLAISDQISLSYRHFLSDLKIELGEPKKITTEQYRELLESQTKRHEGEIEQDRAERSASTGPSTSDSDKPRPSQVESNQH